MRAKTHIKTDNILAPPLRFKEFDGKWKSQKLGNLGDFRGGGTPSTDIEEFWEGDIPWISSSDINEGDVTNLNITRYLTKKAIAESATKIIPKDSVLFVSRVGVGKLAVNSVELCTSQDFASLILSNDASYFIAYYFLARNKLLHQYSQGTSIKGFTTGDLKGIPIIIPTLPEQQKIASFLSAIDDKVQQLTKKKALLEQYKKGVMQQLFSGKLRFKDEDGNAYPDWEEKRLGDFCQINAGGDISKLNFSKVESERYKYPVYANSLINDGLYGYSDTFSIKEESVTVTGRGDVGFANARKGGYTAVVRLLILRPRIKTSIYFLKTAINQINIIVESTGVPQLTSPQLGTYKLTLPSFNEQQKITTYLSSIDAKIESVDNQISQTQTFKKGLLQQMFV